MVEDLFDCLASLGIKEFQLMKIKKIRVTRQINEEAAKAVEIIEGIKQAFEFQGEYESEVKPEENFWCLGSRIETRKGAKNRASLISLTDKERGFGWFGYEKTGDSGIQRCILMYCKNEEHANSARKKFPQATVDKSWAPGEWNLRIAAPVEQESELRDYE